MDKHKFYYGWIIANILLVVSSFFFIWLVRTHHSSVNVTSLLFAQVAILLFLINVNMYFIFLVIRKTKQRKIKIRLAKFSKKMMKWHIKIAISGTLIISGHALVNILNIGPLIGYVHLKMLSGYLSLCLLSFTLAAGYLRHKKATGFRRKFHLVTAMMFAAVFLFHMFVLY